ASFWADTRTSLASSLNRSNGYTPTSSVARHGRPRTTATAGGAAGNPAERLGVQVPQIGWRRRAAEGAHPDHGLGDSSGNHPNSGRNKGDSPTNPPSPPPPDRPSTRSAATPASRRPNAQPEPKKPDVPQQEHNARDWGAWASKILGTHPSED